MKIEMTAAEASDILDDFGQLDGAWEATHALAETLRDIVAENRKSSDRLYGRCK